MFLRIQHSSPRTSVSCFRLCISRSLCLLFPPFKGFWKKRRRVWKIKSIHHKSNMATSHITYSLVGCQESNIIPHYIISIEVSSNAKELLWGKLCNTYFLYICFVYFSWKYGNLWIAKEEEEDEVGMEDVNHTKENILNTFM